MSPRHLADADHPAVRSSIFKNLTPAHRAEPDDGWKVIYQGSFYIIKENAAGETKTEWLRKGFEL